MERYFTQSGSSPELQACWHIAGLQCADQISQEVKDLLALPGVKQVAVFYNHGVGDRVDVYVPIPNQSGK